MLVYILAASHHDREGEANTREYRDKNLGKLR